MPAAHFTERPGPRDWSAAEVYTHILDMNERGARAIEGILDRGALPQLYRYGKPLKIGTPGIFSGFQAHLSRW